MTPEAPPVDVGSPVDELVAAFEACTMPMALWQHHKTHLLVSMAYLLRQPEDQAVERIREGIQRYNASQGQVQTRERGYHETITRFWIHMIRHFLASADRRRPVDELGEALAEALGDQRLAMRYYSRDLLMSWEARLAWHEPDLEPLPTIGG